MATKNRRNGSRKYNFICGINDGYKIELFCGHLYNIGCKRDRRQFL